MSSQFDIKERFVFQLTGKIKTYILSFHPMPEIIDPKAFVKHLYYYAFYDYLKKIQDKLNLRKSEIFEFILKAIYLAVSEINDNHSCLGGVLYKLQDGRYLLS
jgi:hypothetical protein